MIATIPNTFASESQMSLYDAVKSIITPGAARCPGCREIGFLRVLPGSTVRTPTSVIRERVCLNCGYHFETEMKMQQECTGCGATGKFCVPKTKNVRNAIIRIYKCKGCGYQTSTVEPLAIPEHMASQRRRAISADNFQ